MKDWVGEWFRIFGELMNEPQEAHLCALDLRTQKILKHQRVSHADHDGFHGTTAILKAEGYDDTSFPPLKPPPRPSWFQQCVGFIRHASFNAQPRTVAWTHHDLSKKLPSSVLTWHVFSIDDTQRIQENARTHHVSMNSFLLWALHHSVPSLLKSTVTSDVWMIPVNLRGAIPKSAHLGNQVSFIGVELAPHVTPLMVHQSIKSRFEKNYHWGSWWLLNMGRFLGTRGMRWVARQQIKTGIAWIGSLSNMGVWNPPLRHVPHDEHIAWFSCPPMSAYQCLGTCAVVWRHQLILSMDLHPSVSEDPELVKACIKAWAETLLRA